MSDNELTNGNTPVTDVRAGWLSVLRQPLSKLQAIVGVAVGLMSVGGAVFPLVGLNNPVQTHGELVAVVQEGPSRKPILDATVEVYTKEALITTLTSEKGGRASQRLKEGRYRIVVTHPKFKPEVRQIQVMAGQITEVRLTLPPHPVPPPKPASETRRPTTNQGRPSTTSGRQQPES